MIEVVLSLDGQEEILARFPEQELGEVSQEAMHKKAISHNSVRATLSSMNAWGKGTLTVKCNGEVLGEPVPNTAYYAEIRAILPNGKVTAILAGSSHNDPNALKAWGVHIASAMFAEMRTPCQVKLAVHHRAGGFSWYQVFKKAPVMEVAA